MTAFELTSPEAREHDRVPEWDDDPTPRGVVSGLFTVAMPVILLVSHIGPCGTYASLVQFGAGVHIKRRVSAENPYRVLGVGSGYGCWESELAKWWVDVLELPREWLHITAVEINPARGPDLRKWCDDVYIGDWRELLRVALANQRHTARGEGFDLVIGNPPFAELLRQGKGPDGARTEYKATDETMVPTLLEHAPAVMLWHTAGAFDDSEAGREVWRKYQPAAEWKCGRVSCRADGKTDSRSYMTSLWLRGHAGPTHGGMLPRLQPHDRRWTTPPGSESREWARANGYPLAPSYQDES